MPVTQRAATTRIRSKTPRTIRARFMAGLGWKNCGRVCRWNRTGRVGTIYNAIDCFQPAKQGGRVRMALKFPSLLLAAALAPLGAQPALNPPAPFVTLGQAAPAVGGTVATLSAARSAQEMGLPSVAAALYRELLAAPAGAGDRNQIILALT